MGWVRKDCSRGQSDQVFFGSGLFKRENLTKRWFDQGTGWPQRMGAAQPPTQDFPKMDLPKNGVHPKPSAESFLHSLNITLLKNSQWLLIQWSPE